MAYKPVTRTVTVEFVKEERGNGYEVRVTPEHLVTRYGDRITWVVQGLPLSRAQNVKFCNFTAIELSGTVSLVTRKRKQVLVQASNRGFIPPSVSVGANFRATIAQGRALPGLYKYEIWFDDRLLLDPDDEIKGPRH